MIFSPFSWFFSYLFTVVLCSNLILTFLTMCLNTLIFAVAHGDITVMCPQGTEVLHRPSGFHSWSVATSRSHLWHFFLGILCSILGSILCHLIWILLPCSPTHVILVPLLGSRQNPTYSPSFKINHRSQSWWVAWVPTMACTWIKVENWDNWVAEIKGILYSNRHLSIRHSSSHFSSYTQWSKSEVSKKSSQQWVKQPSQNPHNFIPLIKFNKRLLSIFYLPDAILGGRNTEMNNLSLSHLVPERIWGSL